MRNIVCIEVEWNEAQLQQAIGRGPRRKSHSHLPIEEQVVDVYKLCLKKPDDLLPDDETEKSADEMLRVVTQRKEREIRKALKRLKKL